MENLTINVKNMGAKLICLFTPPYITLLSKRRQQMKYNISNETCHTFTHNQRPLLTKLAPSPILYWQNTRCKNLSTRSIDTIFISCRNHLNNWFTPELNIWCGSENQFFLANIYQIVWITLILVNTAIPSNKTTKPFTKRKSALL